jgi:hypothetical protein
MATARIVGMTGLLERDMLVISQKAKLIEMTNEYRILDPEGEEVGAIRQEGQSKTKKLFRLVSDLDQFLTHRLSVYEADGTKLLEIVRPAKVFKSTLHILDVEQGRTSTTTSTRTNEDVKATMREAAAMATVPNRIAGISSRRVSHRPHAAPSTEPRRASLRAPHSQSSPRGRTLRNCASSGCQSSVSRCHARST